VFRDFLTRRAPYCFSDALMLVLKISKLVMMTTASAYGNLSLLSFSIALVKLSIFSMLNFLVKFQFVVPFLSFRSGSKQ